MARVNRKRLKDLRNSFNYSQEELAHLAGVTTKTVQNLESKGNARPTLDTLSRIARALDTTVASLIIEEE